MTSLCRGDGEIASSAFLDGIPYGQQRFCRHFSFSINLTHQPAALGWRGGWSVGDQTLRNWVNASAEGKLKGVGGKAVTPEEMELSRLRVENLKLKRECEILKKRRRTSQGKLTAKLRPDRKK